MRRNMFTKSSGVISMIMAMILVSYGQLDARSTPINPVEKAQEEYRLKQQIKPVLIDVLKEEFVALSVNVLYVMQHEPIINPGSMVEQFSLPGFGSKVTVSNKPGEIAGFINRYIRYRTLVLLVSTKLSPTLEESIEKLLREKLKLELGTKDILVIEEVAAVRKDDEDLSMEEKVEKEDAEERKEKIDSLFQKIDKERKEQKDRVQKLFPELDAPPESIDPIKEAKSSKHLISSRNAYFKNDLNKALNEVIEAININPYSPKSYEMLGSIYYRLKWKNLALSNWVKALALDPDNKKLSNYIEKVKREL